MAYRFQIIFLAKHFTYDSTNYTTNRFNLVPTNASSNIYTYGTPPRYVWTRNVVINYAPSVPSPAFRFDDIELNNWFVTITIECLQGYRFKSLSNAVYGILVYNATTNTGFNGDYRYSKAIEQSWFSFNNDNTQLTFSIDVRSLTWCDNSTPQPYSMLDNTYNTLYLLIDSIDFEEIPVGTYYTITQNLIGCTSDYNKTSELENTEIEINLTPNTNYKFLTVPSYIINGIENPFTESQTGFMALFILTNNVTINANATECYSITQTITNATSSYVLDYMIVGRTITITITPNAGYYFPNGSCTYIDNNGTTSSMNIDVNGNAVCTFYVDSIYQYSGQRIIADAIRKPTEKYGFIGIYKPTLSQLTALSQQRFVNPTSGLVDLTGYVISLKKYYCDIDIDGNESVYYGTHNTQIQCDTIDTTPFELECGDIEIMELYNNTLDYENTQIELYLPFIGNVSLDTKRVMGKTVTLLYKVNPINGDCIAVLHDSLSDIVIESGNISFQIPIKQHETSIYVNNYNENPLFMASLTPQIRIETDEIYNNNPLHGYNNNIWVLISECNGYVMFDDVELHPINKINKNEYDEIISLLQSGVIV